MLSDMGRLVVISCAFAAVVVFSNGIRGEGAGWCAHSGNDHVHHAHPHYHDGEVHTHWHSHVGHEDHTAPVPDGDHHDEAGSHDHDDLPFIPALARAAQGRDATGRFLAIAQGGGVLRQVETPPVPPPKPPSKISSDEDHLHRLRTVILLT
jgi:hypothetical protein